MSIGPLPPSANTMALVAAQNSAPARPAGEMGTDNGGRRQREQDEEFVSALQAASGSKGTEDATVSERGGTDRTREKKDAGKKDEEDSNRRAVIAGSTWHTTMTGMPAPDAAGSLALPAALMAHGQLAVGTGTGGDIQADAAPVAVAGIGVVSEAAGAPGGGPVLNAAGVPIGLAAAGAQGFTVVPASDARHAVEAAMTANANGAAAAAAFVGEGGGVAGVRPPALAGAGTAGPGAAVPGTAGGPSGPGGPGGPGALGGVGGS
ncbi:hypothetical protein FL583_38865, partial [Cryptosporangium phraense]